MKSVLYFCFFAIVSLNCLAADQSAIETADNTRSVLSATSATASASNEQAITTSQPSEACVGGCLSYSGKKNIPPCAVGKSACLSYCEKDVDACCNVTSKKVAVEVPICAPLCPTKESVTRSRDGKRAVYDYGRYEVVVKAGDDGNVSVKYRKRILDR